MLLMPLGGCAGPSLVVLQDPVSGRIVPCGAPPGADPAPTSAEVARCAKAYQNQGWRKLPLAGPSGD